MSRSRGADGSALRDRPAVLDVAIEITALLTAVLALALVALRGRSLSGAVAAWRPFLPLALAVLLGLLAFRSRRPRAGPHVRAGLAPGRWLAGLGSPGLLLAGVFLGVLLVLPPGSETLGADAGAYFEQLGGFFLRGQPGAHPGVEPGAAVLWAPFYLLGHAVAVGARAAGIDVAANGESEPYRHALRLGAAVYGLLAAVFAQRAAVRFVRPLLAAVCAAGFWLGSPLYHYTVAEPLMAHAPGAAASSLLLLLWLRAREAPERGRRWVAVAFVGGLLVTIQRYDAYLLLPTLLSATAIVRSRWRQGDPGLRRRTALAVAGSGHGLRARGVAARAVDPRHAGPLSPEPGDHPLADAVRLGPAPHRAPSLLLERRSLRVDAARAAGGPSAS